MRTALFILIIALQCTNTSQINQYNYKTTQIAPELNMYSTSSIRNPRRVIGYTETGDSINTNEDGKRGNPNDMWNSNYTYYYKNGYWYRKSGNVWEQWNSLLGWGFFGFDWYETNKPNNPTQYYKENPVPIIDGTPVLLIFLVLYAAAKRTKCPYITKLLKNVYIETRKTRKHKLFRNTDI